MSYDTDLRDQTIIELDSMWSELRETTSGYKNLKVKPPIDKNSRWYKALEHDTKARSLLAQIGEIEPTPPPVGSVVWKADMETGDWSQFDYPFDGGTHNPQNNGSGVVSISTTYAHSGTHSIKHDGPTEGSNTRVFEMPKRADGQWSWPNEELIFSAWYYIPTLIHVGGNWNVFQFKSKEIGGQGRNEPFFSFNLFDDASGYRLRVYHKPDGAPSGSGNAYLPEQGSARVHVGEWFKITGRLVQSPLGSKTGRIRAYLNDVLVVDQSSVDTKYTGASTQTWSVNNYGSNLTRPAVIYTDDHRVERP